MSKPWNGRELERDVQGLLHLWAAGHPQVACGLAGSRGGEPGLLSSLGDNNAREAEKSICINHLTRYLLSGVDFQESSSPSNTAHAHPARHLASRPAAHPLTTAKLASEQQLEDMIVREPAILSSHWMLIGRQEVTSHGRRIDLLAVAPDGSLVLIELKRNRTPREIVAQALDYASWVAELTADRIAQIYDRFSQGGSLGAALQQRFGIALDDETLNHAHQIIIVATELYPSTERIVAYLNVRDIPINVVVFQVFQHGFISAGGGTGYSQTLKLVSPGNWVWVKIPKTDYVGVGRVMEAVQAAKDFTLPTNQRRRALGARCASARCRVARAGRRPREVRVLRPGAVAADHAREPGLQRGGPLRQPELGVPAEHPEVAPHSGAAEGGVSEVGGMKGG